MNFEALKMNIIYVLKESQVKLGYTENSARLNYPLDSLNRLLETSLTADEMDSALRAFCEYVMGELGDVKLSDYEGQYTFVIPSEGTRFVHENVQDSGFLSELIELLQSGRAKTIDDLLAVFRKYSDNVRCVEAQEDEFNYVVWFADGKPDSFRYCVDVDLGHITYHRLTEGDFNAMEFKI